MAFTPPPEFSPTEHLWDELQTGSLQHKWIEKNQIPNKTTSEFMPGKLIFRKSQENTVANAECSWLSYEIEKKTIIVPSTKQMEDYLCVVGLVTQAVFDEEWKSFILLVFLFVFFVYFNWSPNPRDKEITIHEQKKLQMFESFQPWRFGKCLF